MSAPKRRLILSVDARNDIKETLAYTHQRWGPEQRRRYRATLYQAMTSHIYFPEMGQPRNDLVPGAWSLPVGRYVVL